MKLIFGQNQAEPVIELFKRRVPLCRNHDKINVFINPLAELIKTLLFETTWDVFLNQMVPCLGALPKFCLHLAELTLERFRSILNIVNTGLHPGVMMWIMST